MDTTPVMRRGRTKLSRRDRGLCSPSPMAVCAASSSSAYGTPLRAPPTDSCWDSPVSPFSPPPLSQTCEVYWEDETQRRTIEEMRRSAGRPADRVPPLPPPLVASPAPLLPASRRRPARATRQQQQQLMALLERAETLCTQSNTPNTPTRTTEPEREPQPEPECEPGPEQPPPPSEPEADSGAPPEIESDPELDRSMLRCTQLAEMAATESPVRRGRSFNAFVMEAMPDDEDEIFSQIPVEALDGAGEPSASSSGASSGSSVPRPAGRGLPRTVSAPDHRPPGETGGRWTAQPGRLSSSQTSPSSATAKVAPPRTRMYGAQAAVRGTCAPAAPTTTNAAAKSASTGTQRAATKPPAAAAPLDPARQKAEMNRRRAEALRRLRQNQRSRSLAVKGQTR
ncbi:serine/arginine repetitive matrix protein 1-like [Amphibalanus amphitrite]|uniref:serine/arginine repetitive matrix protein 1-like n=1 Tax=Amphibalanus amphitrite TaxID=1232801 RepID=UPI001C91C473|nr:serine/arginine repetitive matrix protein 1-like [Amphibalanus amphitrite]XP_043238388.1 serine/arginine repetitive matrix protein 1-like [Amphibalanus amphitrite]XP_043238389.1 serine/arginine repetitive matrix protein 1-like [Amphibalanus amphitrite]XP_043238390.1 serine/arginine repetitive matrix protein 1-like [Amphibalanus amphitrite]XP_043238391.1 serine/arginine repetitive matrix protein 1-like [Amphibalanus amphitrite]